MSKRADARYDDQEWITFRSLVDAWVTLGGTETLARFCGVDDDAIERWRLGTTTPSIKARDAACDWMIGRAQAPVDRGAAPPPARSSVPR